MRPVTGPGKSDRGMERGRLCDVLGLDFIYHNIRDLDFILCDTCFASPVAE